VTVRDRGTGFDSENVMNNPQIAHSMLVIRNRLNVLGCKMEINSQPGIGTKAIIEVPYGNLEP
jgi:signal transduction histidine kinase